MEKRNPSMPPKRLVWRISENSPMGEWIDPSIRRPSPVAALHPADLLSSWSTSSYDLLNGIQVTEIPETEPGELFTEPGELFAESPEFSELHPHPPKRSGT